MFTAGIYDQASNKVIEFSPMEPLDVLLANLQAAMRPHEDLALVTKALTVVGTVAIQATNMLIDRVYQPKIQASDLSKFVTDGKVCVYRYDMSLSDLDINDCCAVPNPDKNGPRAAEIARWFASNPKAFGDYCLATWNCEHFATFCHTTTIRLTYLKEQFPVQKGGVFPRSVLSSFGIPWSCQADRIFGQHSSILKEVVERGEHKYKLLMDIHVLGGFSEAQDCTDGRHEGNGSCKTSPANSPVQKEPSLKDSAFAITS